MIIRKILDAMVILALALIIFNYFVPNYHSGERGPTKYQYFFQSALDEYKQRWNDYPRSISEFVEKTKRQGKNMDLIRYSYSNYGFDKTSKRILLDFNEYDFERQKVKASPNDYKFEFAGINFYLFAVEPEKVARGSIIYRYKYEKCLEQPSYIFYVLEKDEKIKKRNNAPVVFSSCPYD